jgi:hypothetical protein
VYDIWQSKDDFQRFVDEKLAPALAELGRGQGDEAGPQPQFFEIDVLVKPS